MLTLAKYKQLQGIPLGIEDMDELLESCIASAWEMIEQYCNRQFELKRRTVMLDGGAHWLFLSAYPVTEIHAITCAGVVLEDYTLDAGRGMLYRSPAWPRGIRNITVEYTGGFAEDDVPRSLLHAAAMIAKQAQDLLESGGQTATSERIGDYQVTYGRNMVGSGTGAGSEGGLLFVSPVAAALLRPYVAR